MGTIIGKKICEERKKLGWTQEELAAKMGYKTKSAINKIELGINDVAQSKIVRFASVLGTTPAHLMGWDEEEEEAVTPDEQMLLDLFRLIPDEQKDLVLSMIKAALGK